MKPAHALLFLLAVAALLGAAGLAIPEKGLRFPGDLVLRFPSPADVLFPQPLEKVDISGILALDTDEEDEEDAGVFLLPDTTPMHTTLPEEIVRALDLRALPPLLKHQALQFPEGMENVLHPFFASLDAAREGQRPIRVLHYGDSQLEGDRITSYLRHKLQTHFGGRGPGMVAVADIVPHFSTDRVLTGDWKRHSAMDRRDSTLNHQRYGALSAFSRFTPILPDTVAPDTTAAPRSASITLRPNARSYRRAREWTVCRLFFGWHRTPVTIEVSMDGAPFLSEVVEPGSRLFIRTWNLGVTPGELTITFTGADSPDVFAVSLEGHRGVNVDNIAARGAAGYEFNRADQSLLRSMYDALDVKLLILQYGGNTLPNIGSKEEADRYGRFFGAQIARFKKMIPGVRIIVIGPSDMSIKEGEHYVTRPWLEEVRDAMRANALQQGAVFWDMYASMGGRGSMASWVEADPPLAATDYTHFSPAGARKIGELFHSALVHDYAAYRAGKTKTDDAETPITTGQP